ncbi:hypothetical protein B0T14DRAFT_563637 [Immersiella caudata]|uniref:Uncharacterized protein n=1 Tax=Immersiella caudata TaxID=314043 RepID=A0AA39X5U8_9PEZI|nr:hypothetical protein B0T14DRAFT_563637 [Immersiella caudata]
MSKRRHSFSMHWLKWTGTGFLTSRPHFPPLSTLYTALSLGTSSSHVTFFDSSLPQIAPVSSAEFFIAFALRSSVGRCLYVTMAWLLAGVLVAGVASGLMVEWIRGYGLYNDPEKNKEMWRMYVYSEEDRLVNWRCVERQAVARERDLEVMMEKFTRAPHVLHAKEELEGGRTGG